jgi:hypothetical protein
MRIRSKIRLKLVTESFINTKSKAHVRENKTLSFFPWGKEGPVYKFHTQYYIRRENSLRDKTLLVALHNF